MNQRMIIIGLVKMFSLGCFFANRKVMIMSTAVTFDVNRQFGGKRV